MKLTGCDVDEGKNARWTVYVPKETDVALRTHLAQMGLKKGTLSEFVADAVRRRLFDLNLSIVAMLCLCCLATQSALRPIIRFQLTEEWRAQYGFR